MAALPRILTVDAAEEFAQNWIPVSGQQKLVEFKSTRVNFMSVCQQSMTGQTFEQCSCGDASKTIIQTGIIPACGCNSQTSSEDPRPWLEARHQHCWGMSLHLEAATNRHLRVHIHQLCAGKTRFPPQGIATVARPQARIAKDLFSQRFALMHHLTGQRRCHTQLPLIIVDRTETDRGSCLPNLIRDQRPEARLRWIFCQLFSIRPPSAEGREAYGKSLNVWGV